ncbi:relaxase/mobilization nuclease domain-containing protein [Sporomusa ovata]|uniref:relaxase/mobilization nuclease domain-containing protein n=1 Tax=Sporomusa ovata TaxID=2378 RepID=UPI0012694385|nr:hypothetical protein [Sporomusa ovata]
MRQKINYLDNVAKRRWLGSNLPRDLMVGAVGANFNAAYEDFMVAHMLTGFKGSRLFYHLLLDFEAGLLSPYQVRLVGLSQCLYLQGLGAMYAWGIHCIPHPHMHVVINSVLPVEGKKLQIRKGNVVEHKIWANKVLLHHKLPLISMWQDDTYLEAIE